MDFLEFKYHEVQYYLLKNIFGNRVKRLTRKRLKLKQATPTANKQKNIPSKLVTTNLVNL